MPFKKLAEEIGGLSDPYEVANVTTTAIVGAILNGIFSDNMSLRVAIEGMRDAFQKKRVAGPYTHNVLTYVLPKNTSPNFSSLKGDTIKRAAYARKYPYVAGKKISIFASGKIFNKGKIFVHGYDSSIVGAIKRARSNGKAFEVHNTETRPLLGGRKFASELGKGGIKVAHHPDTSLHLAISNADAIFVGCQAILATGRVVGVPGLELITRIASQDNIPLYVCAPSWKLDVKTLTVPPHKKGIAGFWSTAPAGVELHHPDFDVVGPDKITGIISELGIYEPTIFVEETKQEHPWLV